MVAVSAYDYGCATHRDRGSAICAGVRVERWKLDAQILNILREELLMESALEDPRHEVAQVLREREGGAMSVHRAAACTGSSRNSGTWLGTVVVVS